MPYIETHKVNQHIYYRLVERFKDATGQRHKRIIRHLGKSDDGFKTALEIKQKLSEALKVYPDLAIKNNIQAILNEYKRRQIIIPEKPLRLYKTIIIDPPWPIDKILRTARPKQFDYDYPTMTIDEIKAIKLPVDITGCHIYLWTTQKFLPVAFEIFKAWNVNYECLITWIKNVGFTPYSFMYSTEFCLFGRIGNLPLLKLGQRLDIYAKVREHSRKPDEFYELIKEVSPEPRTDYFSREPQEGFEQYGNETNYFARS